MEENEVIEAEVTEEPEVESEVDIEESEEQEDVSVGEDDGSDWFTEDDIDADGEEPESKDEDEGTEDTEPAEDKSESGNQRFKIKYLGNEEELTLEEMTEYAQKGKDYDHVREERDGLRTKFAGADRQLEFLKKLADKAGVSVDEQIDLTEAMWLIDEEAAKGNDLSESEALLRVQRNKQASANTVKEQPSEDRDYSPEIERFISVYPEVKSEDIPKEVWDLCRANNGDLLGAYQTYMIKELTKENARIKQEAQNTKNEQRSTGARKTAGATQKKDEFDEGWDSEY